MEEPTYPSGPFPETAKDAIASIMREVGIANLSIKVLRKRLEAKYHIEFTSHKAHIQELVDELMKLPEFVLELAKLDQAATTKVGGTKKSSRSAPADKKKKPATESGTSKREKKPAKETVEKAPRGKADPLPENYPKRPLGAYFLFINDKRPEILAVKPGLPIKDIAREVGQMWANASPEVKQAYSDRAKAAKEKFDQEMAAYEAAGGQRVKRGRKEKRGKDGKAKKAKRHKDPNAPKRATTAFMQFSNKVRPSVLAENPGLSFTDAGRRIGEMWKALSEEDRKPYEALAAKDKERYAQDLANKGIAAPKSRVKNAKKADVVASSSSSSSGSSDSDSSSSSSSDSDSDSDSSSSSSSSSDSD